MNNDHCQLLRLPLELRLSIYGELLTMIENELPSKIMDADHRKRTPYTRLLLTCRTIYFEACELVAAKVPLYIGDVTGAKFNAIQSGTTWTQSIHPNVLDCATRVVLRWSSALNPTKLVSLLRILPQVCPRLNVVAILRRDTHHAPRELIEHYFWEQLRTVVWDSVMTPPRQDNLYTWIIPTAEVSGHPGCAGETLCLAVKVFVARLRSDEPLISFRARERIQDGVLTPEWKSREFKVVSLVVLESPLVSLDFLE